MWGMWAIVVVAWVHMLIRKFYSTHKLGRKQPKEGVNAMSQELDDLRAEIARNKSVDESAAALIGGLKARLDEIVAKGEATADPSSEVRPVPGDSTMLADLKSLRDELAASSDALASAVSANTPGGKPDDGSVPVEGDEGDEGELPEPMPVPEPTPAPGPDESPDPAPEPFPVDESEPKDE